MAIGNFILRMFLSLQFSELLLFDAAYLALVAVPVYAGITKGNKAYAQPSKKYALKYMWFPLALIVMVFSFSAFNISGMLQFIAFVTAIIGVNIYFFSKN